MEVYFFLSPLIILFVIIWCYKFLVQPQIVHVDDKIIITYKNHPSPLEFYVRAITSAQNFGKPSSLPTGKTIPNFEVISKGGNLNLKKFKSWIDVCGFDTNTTEVPFLYYFATSLPLFANVITHKRYPIRPLSSFVHIKQTIKQLRPLKVEEKIIKKGYMNGGKNTEKGSELAAHMEVYTDNNELVAQGVTEELIVKKRGILGEYQPRTEPVTSTKKFKVPADIGRRYAAASGDYNPWHMYNITAKLFGFKRAIAQVEEEEAFIFMLKSDRDFGLFREALLRYHQPRYPIVMEVEFRRPVFMPSVVVLTERMSDDRSTIYFDLCSEDGQHVHLVGSLQYVPDLQLKPLQFNNE